MLEPKNTYDKTKAVGGNETRPDGQDTFFGYTTDEALAVAVHDGSTEAWDWLKAWFNAELTDENYQIKDWTR